MSIGFFQRLFDPQRTLKPLPAPHKSARVLTFAESVLLHRNAEQMRRQSENFNKPSAA